MIESIKIKVKDHFKYHSDILNHPIDFFFEELKLESLSTFSMIEKYLKIYSIGKSRGKSTMAH